MLVWLTLPFYDFCGFRSVAVNSVYKLQFFTFITIYVSCSGCRDVRRRNVNILQHLQSDRRSGTSTKLFVVSQWPNGNMPDCGVRGPRFEFHRRQLCLSRQPLRYTALGTGYTPLLQYLGRLSLPWVSALGLSNNRMAMVDVDDSCHFFLEDLQSKSVGLVWGLAATSALSRHSSNEPGELSQWLCHDDSTINIILVIVITIFLHNSDSVLFN